MPHIFVRGGATFMPSGMTKNGATQGFAGTSVVQIVGMVGESGSTVSGNSLVPGGTKIDATVVGQVSLTGVGYGSTFTASIYKNGSLLAGATVTTPSIYTSTATVTIPSATTNVSGTDLLSLWISASGSGSGTVAAGINTYVRIS